MYACVVFIHVCVCVHLYVWALGFSPADVSNQSLSRGSLSLYPVGGSMGRLSRPSPFPDGVVWSWVVLLMMGMGRHWGLVLQLKALEETMLW